MSKCVGVIGWLFGHAYSARYSIGAPKADVKDLTGMAALVFSSDIAGIVRSSTPKTYHGDVCARCGSVVNELANTPG